MPTRMSEKPPTEFSVTASGDRLRLAGYTLSRRKTPMRLLILLFLLSVLVTAQQPGGGAGGPLSAPTNLKVLAADTDIPFVMQTFNQALGVQCAHCHVQGDLASDSNPKKDMARTMITMV